MPSDREAEPEHRPVWREWSAERRLAPRQRVVVAALGAAVAAGLVLVPGATLPIIVGALTLLFVGTTFLKAAYFVVGYRARSRSEASDAPPDAGGPRTKPRALNVGLSHVTGQLLTIYDAEDRPEPDQLQKAVLAFDRHPENVA